jgi:hypothetical protein
MTAQEHRIVRELGGIYLAFFIVAGGWHMAPSGTDWGNVAQIATAILAMFAFGTAIYSVYSQRELARKRAAFDVFLKTETDERMLTAYDNFHTGIIAMREASSIHEFCTSEATRSHYLWIRKYLNVHELVAVGIKKHVLDHDVCYEYWGDALMNGYSDAKPVVDYVRARPRNKYTYRDLGTLNDEWVKRKENAHLASSASNS